MKRKYFYLLALSALTLGACSTENDLFGEDPNGGPEGQQKQVTFLFPGTAQGVVPYAGEAIASAEENKIATLDVYVFGRDKLDVTEPFAYLLEDVIKMTDADLTEVADAMQTTLTVRGTNPKVLYFVANGRSHTSLDDYELNVTDTLSFIRKQTTSLGTGLLKAPLLMTGRYTFKTTQVDGNDVLDLTGPHSIALNRRVARFDIINDAENSTLKINKIIIKNARPGAYLFAHADELADAVADDDFPAYDLPTIAELMELDFLSFPTANVGTTPSAFYVYPTEVDGETFFHLSGLSTTSGSPMVQPVKMRLKQVGTEEETKLLPINPNTRYIINVLDAGSATIDATITVKEWLVGEQIDQEAGFGWLKLALEAPIAEVTLDESKLLKVPAGATAAFNIAVTADTEWVIEGADLLPWITLTNLPAADVVGKSFTIATGANPSSEVRKGILYLRNVVRPSVVQALTVEQAGSPTGFKVTGPRFENNTLMAMAAGGTTTLTLTLPDGVTDFSCEATESWITLAEPAPATRAAVPVAGSKLNVTLTANEEKKDGKAIERVGTFTITVGDAIQTITVKQAPKNLGSIVVKAEGLANSTLSYPGAAKAGVSLLVTALTEWNVEAFDIVMEAVTENATTWIENGIRTFTDKNTVKVDYSGTYNFDLVANPTFDERKSKMILTNTFDPAVKLELTIIQKGKLETLTLTGGAEFAGDVLTLAADATAANELTVASDKQGGTLAALTTTGAPGWLGVVVSGADNDQKITVTPTANTTTDAREATITVKMTGATDKKFTVKQAGKVIPPYSIVDAQGLVFGGTGLALTLAVPHTGLAETMITLSVEDLMGTGFTCPEADYSWVTFTHKDYVKPELFLTITPNDTGAERTTTLTISSANNEEGLREPLIITVTQAANPVAPTFTVTGVTGNALAYGHEAVSATEYTVVPSNGVFAGLTVVKQETGADWLTYAQTSLETDGKFTLEATANDTGAPRSATVTVTLPGATAPMVITVTQAAVPALSISDGTNQDISTFAFSQDGVTVATHEFTITTTDSKPLTGITVVNYGPAIFSINADETATSGKFTITNTGGPNNGNVIESTVKVNLAGYAEKTFTITQAAAENP